MPKEPCQINDRIELMDMPNDPCPIPKGSRGTVTWVNMLPQGKYQIGVKWDNGRTLMLVPADSFKIIRSAANA